MRCREAKLLLAAQRDGDLAQSDVPVLQDHLNHCPTCRAFEQRFHNLNTLPRSSSTPGPDAQPAQPYTSISTERIMQAVQRQQRISQQLEDIHQQQQSRLARIRVVGLPLAAIIFFTLGSIPLLLLALMIIQPDLLVNTLPSLGGTIDILIVLGQYLQTGLTLTTHDSRLLAGVALILVVMTGLWLRLMRHPRTM